MLIIFFTDWFKATQGLMALGLGVALIALIVATLSLCCRCSEQCNFGGFVAGLLLTCCKSKITSRTKVTPF